MLWWSFVLMSTLGLVATSPIKSNSLEETLLLSDLTRNSILEEQLKNLLEDFRNTMLNGSDDLPVLDPFQLEYLAIDENVLPLPGLKFEIGNVRVDKLSTFIVKELTVQRTTLLPLRYRVTLDLQIPLLEVDARHYDLFAPVQGVTIFGTGDATINLIEPRISGHVIARPSIGLGTLFIRLEEVQLQVNLKAFYPRINGILGGSEGLSDFVNVFLSHLVPDLIDLYEDDISQVVSSVVLEIGNEILSDINLIGIIGSA